MVIRLANKVVNAVVLVALALLFALGCYALWDSHAVDSQADSIAWQPYKPVEPDLLSYNQLVEINPDVRAWLTVYGTNIDYPVCQNEDESKYLSKDAKGEYALSGSLFMDAKAAPDFSDFNTFIYGHHMEHDVMFGQISDFLDQGYFEGHRYGNLFAGGANKGLEFMCCLSADAYDDSVYRTGFASDADKQGYLDLLRERATCVRDVEVAPTDRIVLLSTCASETTNGRTILVGVMRQQTFDDPFETWPNKGTGVDKLVGWLGLPWYAWVLLAVLLVGVVVFAVDTSHRRRNAGRRR